MGALSSQCNCNQCARHACFWLSLLEGDWISCARHHYETMVPVFNGIWSAGRIVRQTHAIISAMEAYYWWLRLRDCIMMKVNCELLTLLSHPWLEDALSPGSGHRAHDVRHEGSLVLWEEGGWIFFQRILLDFVGDSGWYGFTFGFIQHLIWIGVGPRMRSMDSMLLRILRHNFGQVFASFTVEFLEENCCWTWWIVTGRETAKASDPMLLSTWWNEIHSAVVRCTNDY